MTVPLTMNQALPCLLRRRWLAGTGLALAQHPAFAAPTAGMLRIAQGSTSGVSAPAASASVAASTSSASSSASASAGSAARPGWDVPLEPLPRVQWSALSIIDELLIPQDRPWRQPQRTLTPRYITVHSTGNADGRADALAHGRLMLRGLPSKDPHSRTGYITWHFTVDAARVVQHLPVKEQGDHADFQGPGNRESVGIEMASGEGQTPFDILHRTAFLIARLMRQHGIPAARVVPHQHWPKPSNGFRKDCPVELLEAGVPGERWRRFLALVQAYRNGLDKYRQLPPVI